MVVILDVAVDVLVALAVMVGEGVAVDVAVPGTFVLLTSICEPTDVAGAPQAVKMRQEKQRPSNRFLIRIPLL